MKLLACLLSVLCIVAGCGNKNQLLGVPDSLPALGGTMERVDTRIDSADNLVVAAKPDSGAKGQALLDAAHHELSSAKGDVGEAKTELGAAKNERDKIAKLYGDEHEQRIAVEHGWGYRLQVFVARLFWTIVLITALHYICGAAALFVPGMWGGVLAKIGLSLNPLAWFQSFRDHMANSANRGLGSQPPKVKPQ